MPWKETVPMDEPSKFMLMYTHDAFVRGVRPRASRLFFYTRQTRASAKHNNQPPRKHLRGYRVNPRYNSRTLLRSVGHKTL